MAGQDEEAAALQKQTKTNITAHMEFAKKAAWHNKAGKMFCGLIKLRLYNCEEHSALYVMQKGSAFRHENIIQKMKYGRGSITILDRSP